MTPSVTSIRKLNGLLDLAGQKILFAMRALVPQVVFGAIDTEPSEISTFSPRLGELYPPVRKPVEPSNTIPPGMPKRKAT